MAGILEECGKFSVDLQEISNSIYKNKIKGGEKVKQEDTDKEVFLSYQKILSIAQDSDTIHKAIIDLGIAVSNGNLEIDKIATKVAIDAVNIKMEQNDTTTTPSQQEIKTEATNDNNDNNMSIKILTIDNKEMIVNVNPTCTILQLKQKVESVCIYIHIYINVL